MALILLGQPIVIDLNERKETIMSTNETPQKPTVSIGDLDIVVDINKPSERYIITKKYQGYKLFYKMYRKACTSRLSEGTHFNTLKEAQDHFDSYIKTNWKHTKQFQIEPVSNFFISNWQLVASGEGYYSSHDLSGKKQITLRNVPISIDDYKKGSKKLTTVEELLKQFVSDEERRRSQDEQSIKQWQSQIDMAKQQLTDRTKKLDTLLKNNTTIQNLIEQNTSEAERTVVLFYGKE